jgi:hypothetical protein
MNKPPERLRILFDSRDGSYLLSSLPAMHRGRNYSEHFYTMEPEPMTQKTENLTEKEAWAAVGAGECVSMRNIVHAIRGDHLCYWNGRTWVATHSIRSGPYSIVPDPSKPKEVEDEYNKSRQICAGGIMSDKERTGLDLALSLVTKKNPIMEMLNSRVRERNRELELERTMLFFERRHRILSRLAMLVDYASDDGKHLMAYNANKLLTELDTIVYGDLSKLPKIEKPKQ